ncbi:hypothetical protein [Consotaella aegiceratis]|uniref:hypothetical protein n=1 Tax=Consotaella aegiceratis TaxID=3097961 RepID=UPI002F413760
MAFDTTRNDDPARWDERRQILRFAPKVALGEDVKLALEAGFSVEEIRYMFDLADDQLIGAGPAA